LIGLSSKPEKQASCFFSVSLVIYMMTGSSGVHAPVNKQVVLGQLKSATNTNSS
jgi:hypothetical protein